MIHRLLQRAEVPDRDVETDEALARSLLQADERAAVADLDGLVRSAADVWRRMRVREDVRAVMDSGERLHEVPFSFSVNGGQGTTILRGTIDCLVRRTDGSVLVVEFKTGQRRESHQQQLDVYVAAARALYPGVPVEGVLLYAE